MPLQSAYRDWHRASQAVVRCNAFSDNLLDRYEAVDQALRAIGDAPISSTSDVVMALDAALAGIDLPEPSRQIVVDALAYLKAH